MQMSEELAAFVALTEPSVTVGDGGERTVGTVAVEHP